MRLDVELPKVTKDTPIKEMGVIPEEWLQDVINAASDEGKCDTKEYFFHWGFMTFAAIITDFRPEGFPNMSVRELYEGILLNARRADREAFFDALFEGMNSAN